MRLQCSMQQAACGGAVPHNSPALPLPALCLAVWSLSLYLYCLQVRYDKRVGDNTAIKFMTDGILLR